MRSYNPYDWRWIVGDDESRHWSSSANDWVDGAPSDEYTVIDSEESLSSVLKQFGLIGPVTLVPESVSPAQAEIVLYRTGLLATVNTLIDSHEYEPVRIWWRKATYISRNHPYLTAVAMELGLSDDDVDELFIAASLIDKD